jgi:ferritin-like metal-binding protein YciE
MELGLIPILQVHAEDARGEPALRERVESRIAQARRRADLFASCLSALEPAQRAPEPPPPGDQALKAAITLLAAEHYEAACFRALAAAAQAAGHQPTTRLCEDLLREQHDHARWLAERLPELTARCLARP